MVFECLQDHGILINPSKCKLGIPQLQFLGHQIGIQGIHPLLDKVQAVKEFPQPTTACKLQELLGLVLPLFPSKHSTQFTAIPQVAGGYQERQH